ncbi:hypothetical protein [Rhodococcus sp. 14-2470-1a]|uniref:hypothetical protein n=1 Tax=Rhodococcus sp. 14-2470-1a TaxID=2023150 RepID=UPI000B9BAF77|nr:hypothetical protein [Rhodococcus sp. 14-2470-1a]OZF41887.1 hypothetical protein CH292_27150 [Rhodococcus sp. 14-2470-1a]
MSAGRTSADLSRDLSADVSRETFDAGELVNIRAAAGGRVEVTLAVPAGVAADMTLGHWYEPVSTDVVDAEVYGWQDDGSLLLDPVEAAAVREVLQSVRAESAGKLRRISAALGVIVE